MFMNLSQKNNLATTAPPNIVMNFYRNRSNIPRIQPPTIPVIQDPVEANRMLWGPPIWFMLHTVAHKVFDENFQEIRVELLNIIYVIVTNLPCPICSDHAKEHLKSINFNTIQTKEDLKYFLFDFHNLVNTRKKYPLFTYDELNTKYSTAITKNILQNFMVQFTKKSGNIRLISEDLFRKRMTSNIMTFFEKNINYFLP
jgi:hypothetical protein